MGRAPCCDKNGLKKGPWTQEEDAKLVQYIQANGPGNWRNLPQNAGIYYYMSHIFILANVPFVKTVTIYRIFFLIINICLPDDMCG